MHMCDEEIRLLKVEYFRQNLLDFFSVDASMNNGLFASTLKTVEIASPLITNEKLSPTIWGAKSPHFY